MDVPPSVFSEILMFEIQTPHERQGKKSSGMLMVVSVSVVVAAIAAAGAYYVFDLERRKNREKRTD